MASGLSSRYFEAEEAAREKYEAALLALETWKTESAKREALRAELSKHGLNPSSSSKTALEIKSRPEFDFDPKILLTRLDTLEAAVIAAQEVLSVYDPEVTDFRRAKRRFREIEPSALEIEPQKAVVSVSKIEPLVWYSWKDPKWRQRIARVQLRPVTGVVGELDRGPGEDRIAKIIGGVVQGSSVGYDIVTYDGKKWEVKFIERLTSTFRTGTKGRAVVSNMIKKITLIMDELKRFVSSSRAVQDLTPREENILNYVKEFLDDEYSMIVENKEISQAALQKIFTTLRVVAKLKRDWVSGLSEREPTPVNVGQSKIVFGPEQYLRFLKRSSREFGDPKLTQEFSPREIAAVNLVSEAFSTPVEFMDKIIDLVDVRKIFEGVSGVFVVTTEAFMLVPVGKISEAFQFVRVSQGYPLISLSDTQ